MRNHGYLRSILPGFFLSFLMFVGFETRGAIPAPGPMTAAPVTLGWNPSTDPSVAGYAVYYGPPNSETPSRVDAGSALSATLFNLDSGSNYIFSVVAYDSAGDESPPSNVIAYTPGALSKLTLGRLGNGSMDLSFRTAPGASCVVNYATRLGSLWTQLSTVQPDTNGVVNFVDNAGMPSRFYQVVRTN
jgi:hypothetical protein